MLKDHGLGMCEEMFFSMILNNIKMYGITATVPSDIGMAANKNRKKKKKKGGQWPLHLKVEISLGKSACLCHLMFFLVS